MLKSVKTGRVPLGRANLTWLTDTLATGGDFDYNDAVAAAQLQDLINQQVGVVIDCRIEADDAALWSRHPEVEYHHLPEDDYFGHHMSNRHFDKAVQVARTAQAGGKKVFTHCHMGVNRGTSTAFAILLDRGYSAEEAFDLIRAKRPIAGVYYAEDALRAHLLRQGVDPEPLVRRFRAHRDAVFGADQIAQVQHSIRQTHINRGDL